MKVNADIYPESSDDNGDDDEDSNVSIRWQWVRTRQIEGIDLRYSFFFIV